MFHESWICKQGWCEHMTCLRQAYLYSCDILNMHFEVIPSKDSSEIMFLFEYTFQSTVQHLITLSTSFLFGLRGRSRHSKENFHAKFQPLTFCSLLQRELFLSIILTVPQVYCNWTMNRFNDCFLYCWDVMKAMHSVFAAIIFWFC